MRADSAVNPGLARVIPLRPIELPQVTPLKRISLFGLRWRRDPGVNGMVAMADLGRETGARC
jgi:hypothetical protein